jgi:hypothetical protein
MAMTDHSRIDILAPKTEHRSTMVTSYFPVAERDHCNWKLVKYMPDETAKLFSKEAEESFSFKVPFGSVRLQMCDMEAPKKHDSHCSDFGKKDFPLVLFSPGHHDPRLVWGAQASAMASHGYVVVTIVSYSIYCLIGRAA